MQQWHRTQATRFGGSSSGLFNLKTAFSEIEVEIIHWKLPSLLVSVAVIAVTGRESSTHCVILIGGFNEIEATASDVFAESGRFQGLVEGKGV